MGTRLNVFGLLLKLLALKICLNEAVTFKFTNFVCDQVNVSLIDLHTCRLRAVSRNKTTLNLNLTLHHRVEGNVQIDGQLFQKASGYKPWLYKASIDACRFAKKAYNPIAIIVYKILRSYSNLNHSCPYEGLILVQDLSLRLEHLPQAIPTGDYLLRLDWLVNKKKQLRSDIYFIFAEDL